MYLVYFIDERKCDQRVFVNSLHTIVDRINTLNA